jgi:adenosylcobinamide-phosphate synthase
MMAAWWQVAAGVGLDLLIGDPRWFPHPVRGIGWLAARAEPLWRATGLPLRAAGVFCWITMVGLTTELVALTLPWLAIFWIWAFVAIRDLDLEATAVLRALERGDLAAARLKLSWIVGRDTAHLDEQEVLRGALETLAENLSDAIVAPLFYLALGGPAAMAAYKAVNTLDSMFGYRNERYREFGWCAARLDDVANFLPARLTALLVWLTALLMRLDLRRSVRVTLRDAAKQPSPNSGYPEAAVAGALGIRLGGLNYYAGVPSRKEFLGDPVRPLSPAVFAQARGILYLTAVLMTLLAAGARA